MRRELTVLACSALMAFGAMGGTAVAQQRAAGEALQKAVERTCIVEISSASDGQRIELQNLCFNPRAVRISWGDGRIYDYCLNSSGDVRYVVKLSSNYQLTREQDILLCQ
ncbi:hypothetical protein [Ancylobacter pratisalsi]|uniref:PepSY domain-containing protein n=1 Tax=Ancylobacter pratisalsi TaxID=1745854 RepID=A0A6P1YI07_9HYPH|nr:hypothetical protein [Ancylobacter pratisalsi]QIB32725.1 hypothetical protein G3A50_02650 [Ancylobacter pratisalsi]